MTLLGRFRWVEIGGYKNAARSTKTEPPSFGGKMRAGGNTRRTSLIVVVRLTAIESESTQPRAIPETCSQDRRTNRERRRELWPDYSRPASHPVVAANRLIVTALDRFAVPCVASGRMALDRPVFHSW